VKNSACFIFALILSVTIKADDISFQSDTCQPMLLDGFGRLGAAVGQAAEPTVYPKIETVTESLVVADMEHDALDSQVTAAVLQGIVNRESTEKIYLYNTHSQVNRPRHGQAHAGKLLLDELYADLPQTHSVRADDRATGALLPLIDRFETYIAGLIIWDPELEAATINAAVTIAGQTDGLAVSPSLARYLQQRYDWPVIEDLRSHRFVDDSAVLDWSLEHWMPGANKEIAAVWTPVSMRGTSWGSSFYDYVVANRLFTWSINERSEEQRAHCAVVLPHYAPGTPFIGWISERYVGELFHGAGYYMAPIMAVENLTVHASFPSSEGVPVQAAPQPAPLHDDAVYISMQVTDGDNLMMAMTQVPLAFATSPAHDQVPLSWTTNPILVDLAPRLFDWKHARLGSQELVAHMSDGRPNHDAPGFDVWAATTRHYLDRSGIQTLKVMGQNQHAADAIQPYMLTAGYKKFNRIGPYEYGMTGETFEIGFFESQLETATTVEQLIEWIQKGPEDEPLFVNIWAGNPVYYHWKLCFTLPEVRDASVRMAELAEALRAVEAKTGRRFYFVRNRDLAATYRLYQGLPILPETNTP